MLKDPPKTLELSFWTLNLSLQLFWTINCWLFVHGNQDVDARSSLDYTDI